MMNKTQPWTDDDVKRSRNAFWIYLREQPLDLSKMEYNSEALTISCLNGLLATDEFYRLHLNLEEQEAYYRLDQLHINGMNRAHFGPYRKFSDAFLRFQKSDADYYHALSLIQDFGTKEEQEELGFVILFHEEIDKDATDLTDEQRDLIYQTTMQIGKRVLATIAPQVDAASDAVAKQAEMLLYSYRKESRITQ